MKDIRIFPVKIKFFKHFYLSNKREGCQIFGRQSTEMGSLISIELILVSISSIKGTKSEKWVKKLTFTIE